MRAKRSTESWDAAEFEALYRRHERAVAGFLMRRTGRAELAAEVFAAALIAWRAGTERPANEQAWLYGIARHKLIDSYRKGQVEERAVVTGRVIDERPYDELAAVLGLSEQVVRKRVSRSLAQLRAAMGGTR